jgi:hypothetical protein
MSTNFEVDLMKKKWRSKVLYGACILTAILIAICAIYLFSSYPADEKAIEKFAYSKTISKEYGDDRIIAYTPEDPRAGLIFYPGGKVDDKAYEPLMLACAEQGILCVLLEMPFNLAVLDVNAADGIREIFPQIENWYIGGHSLGGSMAASYLSKNTNDFQGLILLGSYSTADFSDTSLKVLSIYGSEDKVLNKNNYDKSKSNLPSNFIEIIIDGGCHAYFGMYGKQDKDGEALISNEDQIIFTANYIHEFMFD